MLHLDLEMVKNEIAACERSVRFFSTELDNITGFKTQYAKQELEKATNRLSECRQRYNALRRLYGESTD